MGRDIPTRSALTALFSEATNENVCIWLFPERLGFRAYTKRARCRGTQSYTSTEIQDFYRYMSKESEKFPYFSNKEDVLRFALNPESSIHNVVQELLDKFGSKIWNVASSQRALAVDDQEYQRHLLLTNPADKAIIQSNIYGWLLLRACRKRKGHNRISSPSTETDTYDISDASTTDVSLRLSGISRRGDLSPERVLEGKTSQSSSAIDCLPLEECSVTTTDRDVPNYFHPPGTHLKSSLYRADVASMVPTSVNNDEQPPPRRVSRMAWKTHKKIIDREKLEKDDDDLYEDPSTGTVSGLLRVHDGISLVETQALRMRRAKRKADDAPSRTSFNNLRKTQTHTPGWQHAHKQLKRWGSSGGSSTPSLSSAWLSKPLHNIEQELSSPLSSDHGLLDEVMNDLILNTRHDNDARHRNITDTNVQQEMIVDDTPAQKVANAMRKGPSDSPVKQQVNRSLAPQVRPQSTTPPRGATFQAKDTQQSRRALASSLFQVLVFCKPDKYDIEVFENVVSLLNTVSTADAERLDQIYGDSSERYYRVLESWLFCINALVSFRQETGFHGEKSARAAFIANLTLEQSVVAMNLLIPTIEFLGVLSKAELSEDLAFVFYHMGSWPDGLSLERMCEYARMFNEPLMNWF